MSAANSHPDFPVLRWLDDRCKVVESRTYADLLQASRKTAATLIANGAQPGDRAVLCHSQGLEFIAAFYGCLLARVIAGNAMLLTTPPSPTHPPHTHTKWLICSLPYENTSLSLLLLFLSSSSPSRTPSSPSLLPLHIYSPHPSLLNLYPSLYAPVLLLSPPLSILLCLQYH